MLLLPQSAKIASRPSATPYPSRRALQTEPLEHRVVGEALRGHERSDAEFFANHRIQTRDMRQRQAGTSKLHASLPVQIKHKCVLGTQVKARNRHKVHPFCGRRACSAGSVVVRARRSGGWVHPILCGQAAAPRRDRSILTLGGPFATLGTRRADDNRASGTGSLPTQNGMHPPGVANAPPRVDPAIAELKPHRHCDEAVEACVRYMEANKDRMRYRPLPETRPAGRIRRRGKRVQADRREPVQAGGVPLVEGGRQRPARRQMLHRQQPLGRLPRLEGLPRRSRLTTKNGMHPVSGDVRLTKCPGLDKE